MPRKRRGIPWLEWVGGMAYVCWYDATAQRTKRLSLRTSDTVEAQQRYAAFLTEGHDILAGDRRGSSGLTVTQALDDYYREHVVPNVVDKVRQENAIVHLKAWFKSDLLKNVDIPASRAYADARRAGVIGGGKRHKAKEGADSTIRRELIVLQAAANHAAKWKRIGPNATPPTPMPSLELPAEARGEANWLTKAELSRALDAASEPLRSFIMVAYYTGARRASVERLTRFQVDLTNNRINLTAPTENVNQRRSKKRRPVVPIDPLVRPTIERLMEEHKDSEWLFGAPLHAYRPFREHLTAIGLADKSNPHILRHSRATHLLQDGVPIYDVARLLGDTVATVERVYGHHSSEYLAETIKGRAG